MESVGEVDTDFRQFVHVLMISGEAMAQLLILWTVVLRK